MKVKNLTPFPFGTKVTSRRPPRPEMTLILRACYVLAPGKPLVLPAGQSQVAQGPMSAAGYSDEDVERTGECLYPGDFADWKPNAEVMLRGTCHTPSAKPLDVCPVRFTVGAWSKTLRVVGRRMWTDDARDARMSKPVPFTKMPVDYAHAFGGAGYAANPAGMGASERELPNVEHAGKVIEKRRDDPGPAGFGPLNPAWPQRAPKVGKKYDARWKKERSPYYAEDFDWTYFNAAPADQQLEGYLKGNERVVFQNLHPDAGVFETTLPGLRIRAFVKDVEKHFREVPMHLDTLFADLDAGKLYLTWRGLDAVQTDDMKDVLWALVASETLAEDPLPEAHYRERLAAFEADPRGIQEKFPAALLGQREEMKLRKRAREEGRPVAFYDAPPPDPMTANLRTVLDGLPVTLPDARAMEQKVADAVASAIAKAPPQVDMKAQIAKAANDAAIAIAKPRVAGFSLRPGGPPPSWATENLQKAVDQLGQAKKMLAGTRFPAATQRRLDEEIAKLDDEVEAIKRKRFFQRVLDRPAPREPGPGKDLRGQDYAGRDLRGRDLRGANLGDANLAGANLAGAKLEGAKLEAAVLCGADLTEADLTGADLTLANLTAAHAARAVFRDAKLTRAFLQKADLAGAVLRGARGDFVFFPDADLAGVDCRGVSLVRAFGKGAKLAGADFSDASLVRCLLLEVSAAGVKMPRAVLTRTSFAKGDLTGASFAGACGERTVWLKATLHDADFGHANLPKAQWMEASARGARFRRAVLKEWRCYRTSFEQADFTECQLFGIELTKCALAGARFTGACLYGAKFRQATGGGVDFSRANMTRALLEDA
ncbi:MAG: DUF2169 domain-containing protein [Polyangiaceae bacterium]